jgi:hypothetical protein
MLMIVDTMSQWDVHEVRSELKTNTLETLFDDAELAKEKSVYDMVEKEHKLGCKAERVKVGDLDAYLQRKGLKSVAGERLQCVKCQ